MAPIGRKRRNWFSGRHVDVVPMPGVGTDATSITIEDVVRVVTELNDTFVEWQPSGDVLRDPVEGLIWPADNYVILCDADLEGGAHRRRRGQEGFVADPFNGAVDVELVEVAMDLDIE